MSVVVFLSKANNGVGLEEPKENEGPFSDQTVFEWDIVITGPQTITTVDRDQAFLPGLGRRH